ncbi:MAG: hypothetical protein ACKV2U_20845 [Bryobacteraceae bacterium]
MEADGKRPGDLAILTNGRSDQVLEIAKRTAGLKSAERQRILTQLVLLSGLGRFTEQLGMELKTMETSANFYKNEFVHDAIQHARADMMRGQQAKTFGNLPE